MKSMMMSIMVMVCVLLVLHEEMSVEAGKLQRIGKKIRKAFDECCKKLNVLLRINVRYIIFLRINVSA